MPTNPFRWDDVTSNLPGSKQYDPSRPRLYKSWKGKVAATIQAYVDDIRGIGNSEDNCNELVHELLRLFNTWDSRTLLESIVLHIRDRDLGVEPS